MANEDDQLDNDGTLDLTPEVNPSDFPIEPEDQSHDEMMIEDSSGDQSLSGSVEDNEQAALDNKDKADKHKKRVSGKTRINQLFREKSQAEHEAQVLRAENERLRQLSEVSNNAAMTHYDKSVKLRLERAIQLKTEALQNEDIEAQVKADVEMSRVAAQIEQLDAWKAQQASMSNQQAYQQQQQTMQPQYEEQEPLNEVTENWLSENTWFVPGSQDYDPDMQEEVQAFADALDRKLRRTGQADRILTDEYFDEINDYVSREFYGEQPQSRVNKGNLTMKPINNRAPVAPVSRSGQTNAPQKSVKITLTSEERDFARLSGITPEAYAKHKMESQKILRDKGR